MMQFLLTDAGQFINFLNMILLLPLPSPANLTPLEMLAVKESFRQSEIVSLPRAKALLIASGISDADGKMVSNEILADMLTLAEATPEDRSAFANSLPPENRLRRFYDHVIMDQSENARTLIECISQRIGLPHPFPEHAEPQTFETKLLAGFQKRGDFSNGKLSGPSLSSAPYRILWTYRGDISEGFEEFYSKDEQKHRRTYELVAAGRFEELAKSHSPSSIPAFKAWHRMSDFKSPPLIKSHLFMHLGKRTLRLSLYCTTARKSPGHCPSNLILAITEACMKSQFLYDKGWVVAGPPTHQNLSLSRNFQKNDLDDISIYIQNTFSAWTELEVFLKELKSKRNSGERLGSAVSVVPHSGTKNEAQTIPSQIPR